jgi:hypothetical protein
MKRLAFLAAAALAGPALSPSAAGAQPRAKPPEPIPLPAVGATLPLTGEASWPKKLDWMYDVPSTGDATGKIVVHWFCAPKVTTCTEDLARVVTLKENARVYIVGYISGTRAEAKKLDPIRETEGVGRGTLAFGRAATMLAKQLGATGPLSIVVGIDGKVAHVTASTLPADLDARDAKVTALSAAIRDYTVAVEGPKVVKPDEKFRLAMTIKLAPWFRYSQRTVAELKLAGLPPGIKCDATALRGDQLMISEGTLTAQVACSGPKGVYEMRGELRFGYEMPGRGGAGLGTDSAVWKFEIKPAAP